MLHDDGPCVMDDAARARRKARAAVGARAIDHGPARAPAAPRMSTLTAKRGAERRSVIVTAPETGRGQTGDSVRHQSARETTAPAYFSNDINR